MADFCKACLEELFDEDFGDLEGLCEEGEVVGVICEGCGFVFVDHRGICQGAQQLGSAECNHKPEAASE